MNEIQWRISAIKQLRKIAPRHALQIRTAVSAELVDLTQARNVKKLTKHQYPYRLRVGNYRVFFSHDGEIHIVAIEEVVKRDERTY
jgi:mRNA interferase RelE/StbE